MKAFEKWFKPKELKARKKLGKPLSANHAAMLSNIVSNYKQSSLEVWKAALEWALSKKELKTEETKVDYGERFGTVYFRYNTISPEIIEEELNGN